jgi:hypothetical protein
MFAKLDDLTVDFENAQFFELLEIVGYTSDMMKLGVVQPARPRMSPITDRIAREYLDEFNLSSSDRKLFDRVRLLVVKEYFRFYTWFQMSDKFSNHSRIDVAKWIEYHYKKGSLFYQIYYGEE